MSRGVTDSSVGNGPNLKLFLGTEGSFQQVMREQLKLRVTNCKRLAHSYDIVKASASFIKIN